MTDIHRSPEECASCEGCPLATTRRDFLREAFGAALAAHVAHDGPSVLVARAALGPPPTSWPRWYRAG